MKDTVIGIPEEPVKQEAPAPKPYKHPTDLESFEEIYKEEYQRELDSCDRWIKWCEKGEILME